MGTTLSAELELKVQWLAQKPELMAAARINDSTLAVEAIVSHTIAAELWNLGDLLPEGFHFTVNPRQRSRQPEVQFHQANLDDSDWRLPPESGLPITTVARTIVGLAQDGHEIGHILTLIDNAGQKSLADAPVLVKCPRITGAY